MNYHPECFIRRVIIKFESPENGGKFEVVCIIFWKSVFLSKTGVFSFSCLNTDKHHSFVSSYLLSICVSYQQVSFSYRASRASQNSPCLNEDKGLSLLKCLLFIIQGLWFSIHWNICTDYRSQFPGCLFKGKNIKFWLVLRRESFDIGNGSV